MTSFLSCKKSFFEKPLLWLTAFICLTVTQFALADQPLPAKIRVLFIGNSYTHTFDIPVLIAKMFAEKGVIFEHESDTPGGASLSDHWTSTNTLPAIRRGGWDYVVLQDQSSQPVNNRQGVRDQVKQFDTEIRKVGARTLVYQTWPLKANYTGTFPNLTSSEGPYINETYRLAAADVGAILVPVGTGWPVAVNTIGLNAMYYDSQHPSQPGAYLCALTFYRTLTRLSTTGLAGASGVNSTQVMQAQAAANGVALAPTVAPTFNLTSGTYAGTQRVRLNTVTPQATIYYTTDNTTPTTSSPSTEDGGIILVSQTTTLKALAVGAGSTSGTTTATFTITSSNGQTLFGNGSLDNQAVVWPGNPADLAGTNAGFEIKTVNPTTGVVTYPPWGFYGGGGPVDGTFVHTGAAAAQLSAGGLQRYVTGLSSNTLYEASIWYRYGTDVASTAFTAQGFSNPSTGVTGNMPNVGKPLAWRKVSRRFTTDATTTSVQLVCQRNSDTTSLDDLEFYKVPDGYELGTRLRSSVAGKITALRAWRPPGGAASYTLRLWNSAGAVLDQVTVSGLSATGWFEGTLATPRSITANTTYTVSYGVTEGGYYQSAASELGTSVGPEVISTLATGGAYGLARSSFPNVPVTTNYSADARFVAITKESWRSDNFTSAELSDPAMEATRWGDKADPDKDGIPNLVEYALETSPIVANKPAPGLAPTSLPLKITFTRARPDVTYQVESTDDLVTWNILAQNPGNLGQSSTVTDTVPANTPRHFVRLRILP